MRGATGHTGASISINYSFNPRAHAGRDPPRRFQPDSERCFNPRAHAGRDIGLAVILYRHIGFNPRAHAGRDSGRADSKPDPAGFQSTRPCGARLDTLFAIYGDNDVSIHAPMRGATIPHGCGRLGVARFNPRAHAGRDISSGG